METKLHTGRTRSRVAVVGHVIGIPFTQQQNMFTIHTVVTPRNGNHLAHRSHTQSRSDGTYVATGFIPWNEGRPMNPASPVGATPNASPVNVFGCSGESLPID
jgi:hypothetical protein